MDLSIRGFISLIQNKIKALGIDDYISPRFIYNESVAITSNFLKKEVSSNKLLYKNSSGWTEIENLKMVEVPISDCGLNNCFKLMRSECKLPSMYNSKFGAIIKQVSSLNFSQDYQNIYSPKQYIATTKREFQGNMRYFFILNDFLYIPIQTNKQSSPELVRIEAYFVSKYEVSQFVNKMNEDCSDCKKNVDVCKSLLDYEITIPDFLVDDVKNSLINLLAQTYLKLPIDPYPNMNPLEKQDRNPT